LRDCLRAEVAARFFGGFIADEVELRAAGLRMLEYVNLLNGRRMERENALHADAVRGLTHRDGCRNPPAVLTGDHQSLERLDAFLLPFPDFLRNADNIARPDGGEFFEVVGNECVDGVHGGSYSISGIAAQSAKFPENAVQIIGQGRFEMPPASGWEAECE